VNRKDYLSAVGECILKDRNAEYGDPEDNFRDTAAIWNVHLSGRLLPGKELTATDVAALMVGLKLARMRTSPAKADHWVDIGGYAGCGVECATREKNPIQSPQPDEQRIPRSEPMSQLSGAVLPKTRCVPRGIPLDKCDRHDFGVTQEDLVDCDPGC
jgi:hypothetical protein